MKHKNVTLVSICIIIIIILLGLYLIISSRIKAMYTPNYNLDDFYPYPIKTLGVNEYQVVKVDDEEVIRDYFNSFIRLCLENTSEAYSLLDNDYAIEFYPTLNSFKEYVASITDNYTYMPVFSMYTYLSSNDDTTTYQIKDKNNNIYIFEVEAVMKYTVRFQ